MNGPWGAERRGNEAGKGSRGKAMPKSKGVVQRTRVRGARDEGRGTRDEGGKQGPIQGVPSCTRGILIARLKN